MDNLEKLATLGTYDTRRGQTKQYVLDTTMRKQTQITYIRHESSYKQLEVKRTRTSFLSGNNNGSHNKELRTQIHIIGQHGPHQFLPFIRLPPF